MIPLIIYLRYSQSSQYIAFKLNPTWYSSHYQMEPTKNSLLIYTINRISLFIFFIIIGAGGVVQILRRYRINYIYIFEINPIQQLTHFQIYTIGLLLMTMYCACMAVQDIQCMYGLESTYRVLQPSFICFTLFFWFMLWPVNHF